MLDFYVPALSVATSYDRLAGFFSSAALAVAARGLSGLIHNDGVMRIVSCPMFSSADLDLLGSLYDVGDRVSLAERAAIAALDVDGLADELARDHVRAMAWMLAEGRLDIRLAVPADMELGRQGLFHEKVGIITDRSGDAVCFSGSINETAAAWLDNIEQFKVFKSWNEDDRELVDFDGENFQEIWNQSSHDVDVVELPQAVKRKMVALAPKDLEDLDLEEYARRRQRKRNKVAVKLRDYQVQAVDAWEQAGHRGILEMATGTGKTKTAAECIRRLNASGERALTVVTAPYQHIAVQWTKELADLHPVLAHGGTGWKAKLADMTADIKLGSRRQVTVVAVANTAGSSAFVDWVEKQASVFDTRLFIGDEMHGLGAKETRRALLESYTHRLGLSATPDRYFDEEGTEYLRNFFGDVVYVFGIKEALAWEDPVSGLSALCPYEYHPVEVHLEGEELEQYLEISNKLVAFSNKTDEESMKRLELLLFKRAAIVKTASQKAPVLREILDRVGTVEHCLVYCHSTEQMIAANEVLHSRNISYHRFTGDEGTAPLPEYGGVSEREVILRGLDDGTYQALVAMKCLDEGVDVPSARLGVILASSGSPREYIQRRGRLLRRSPGKKKAVIYDLVVVPDPSVMTDDRLRRIEHDIWKKELSRVEEFGSCADNALDVHTWILELLGRMN